MTHTGEEKPFSLSSVLEAEYVALHGRLPSTTAATESDRLAVLYGHVHNLPQKRTALCFSGGGIRSATFALGVLQGLARLSLLKQFDYLSTVSGGGYIGSWLTAWIHRHPAGIAGVTDELRRSPSSMQDAEPKPVNWLRRYSNYLSPRLGLLSVDSWTLLGTYLRNLTLNWLVLVPLLAAGLLAPRLLVSILHWESADPLPAAHSMFVVGLLFGLAALAHLHLFRPSLDSLRSQVIWSRFERQQWFLIGGLTPLLAAALNLSTAYAWYRNGGGRLDQLSIFGLDSRGTFVLGGATMSSFPRLGTRCPGAKASSVPLKSFSEYAFTRALDPTITLSMSLFQFFPFTSESEANSFGPCTLTCGSFMSKSSSSNNSI